MKDIRKLYDKLFDSCLEIEKIKVWIYSDADDNTIHADPDNYIINDKKARYNIINANNSDLDAINRTIREFKNYSGTVTQNIMKDLILLRDLCNNSKIKETNKLLTAIDGFNFNVNVTPFIEYMGERFPWSSLDGVEFTIYRDGAVEYRVSK